ncbi:hypothetical protein GKE82_15195 [Conexibacter sp. W3-3-2]|uniref:hypothetical protein n=1 Tax=Conexibacter sp. W3-3-2 TaxID=2675227 RepID=UPI0012B83A09|nr:hypothetical protein [Conexibacter sp. W3-3-2]MTD45595.1 hypothetical protein [Conexibacter sp. W3-3-2]
MTPPGATPQIVVLEVTPSDGYQRHLLLEHGMRAPEVARTVIDLAVIQPADRAQILNALEQLSSALELSSRALIDRDGNVLQPALGVQLADDNTGSFVVSGLTGSLEAAALALLEDALASFAQERAVYDDLARALDGLVQVDRLQSRPAWSARHALTAEQGRRALRVYAALQRSRTLSELAYRQVVASDIEPTADEINITTLLSPELAQQLSDEVRDVAAAEDVRTAERTLDLPTRQRTSPTSRRTRTRTERRLRPRTHRARVARRTRPKRPTLPSSHDPGVAKAPRHQATTRRQRLARHCQS